jgi:hypothetical protein
MSARDFHSAGASAVNTRLRPDGVKANELVIAAFVERWHARRICALPGAGRDCELPQLTAIPRCVVPYGGLVRGRLAAGETVKRIDHSNRIVSVNPVLKALRK